MTRAYPEATGDVVRHVVVPEVLALDLALLSGTTPAIQLDSGDWLWSKGNPPTKMFPANAYSGIDVQPSTTGGVWFISGDSNQTEMSLAGIRVTGFCQPVQTSFSDTNAFQAGCRTEFGDQLNTESFGEPKPYVGLRADGPYLTLQSRGRSRNPSTLLCAPTLDQRLRLGASPRRDLGYWSG